MRYHTYRICVTIFSLFVSYFDLKSTASAVQMKLKPTQHAVVDAVFNLVPFQFRHATVARSHEWQDLDLDLMMQKMNKTKTAFGFWGLTHLGHPVSDADDILHRQAIVRKIVEDPILRLKFVNIFDTIKTSQDDFLSYWDAHDSLRSSAVPLYYSLLGSWSKDIDHYLNRSGFALEGAAFFDLGKSMFTLAGVLGISGIVAEMVDSHAHGKPVDYWKGLKEGFKKPIQINSPYSSVYESGYVDGQGTSVWARGTAGDYYTYMSNGGTQSKLFALFSTGVFVALMNARFVREVHDDSTHLMFLYKTGQALQRRMVHIAQMFKAIEQLHELSVQHQDIFGAALVHQLNFALRSKEMQKLVSLLKTSTFSQAADYMHYGGKVLLAHQLFDDLKNELIPMMQAVAQLDAYYGIAQAYNDQSSQAPFCFAQFVNDDAPCLELQDFWTPLIPTQMPVLNSITWNRDTHTKILITGPSGAGKSTVMKAMAHSIFLAQSFGIVPAKQARLKIFNGLRSSLSPREDLQQNLSTFMAEKARIDDIRLFILNQKRNDNCFVVLDEPYRGTVDVEAAYRVCNLGKELAPIEECMLVMATHLEGPVALAEETGAFANFQLDLESKSDGKFVRTFRLIPDAALWWFTDADKRRRFVDQLLDDKNVAKS